MTHFRHWKTGSTGLWFPQIKVSPMTVPAYSLESFQAMAWGGRWWGDSEFIRATFKRQIRVPGSQTAKNGAEPWRREIPCQARAVVRAPPVSHWVLSYMRMNTNTWDQEKATESSKPNNPRADKAEDHSLCSYQPEVRDLLPQRTSCPHKSLGIKLSWPLTKGWSGSLLTKLKTKA